MSSLDIVILFISLGSDSILNLLLNLSLPIGDKSYLSLEKRDNIYDFAFSVVS